MTHRTDGLYIVADYEHDEPSKVEINKYPDECPACDRGGRPVFCFAYVKSGDSYGTLHMEVVFRCPFRDCQRLYFVHYEKDIRASYDAPFFLKEIYILRKVKFEEFPETINKLSERFKFIYNQSKVAEENKLNEICGTGYKKALEFLVKDYLINHNKEKAEVIKNEFLGNSIKRINDKRIQSTAARATWLANDESHYTRIWEDKDIEDLKMLIKLTINWIDSEILTERMEKEMPPKDNKKVMSEP